jgi:hypothetical protein
VAGCCGHGNALRFPRRGEFLDSNRGSVGFSTTTLLHRITHYNAFKSERSESHFLSNASEFVKERFSLEAS